MTKACLTLLAGASVAWWYANDLFGQDDLRPYLLHQALPLILIPLWQTFHASPRRERIGFAIALLLISLHTIKHLLASTHRCRVVV